MALLPALMMAACAVVLNRFALIDDGATVSHALNARFLDNFQPEAAAGRVRPLALLYPWTIVRVLPAQPWAFSLCNGAFVVLAVWQVHSLARRYGGVFAGVAAAWLFTFSLPTVECLFTLSKSEPQQLVFWLTGLFLLAGLFDTAKEHHWIKVAALVAVTAGTVLFKETGLLIVFPAVGVTVAGFRNRPLLQGLLSLGRNRVLMAFWTVVAAVAGVVAWYAFRPSSYSLAVLAGNGNRDLFPLWSRDVHTLFLLGGGLIAGGFTVLHRRLIRTTAGLVLIQLLVLAAFWTAIRAPSLYYYYPGVAMAAILTGISLSHFSQRGTLQSLLAAGILATVTLHGGIQSVLGGQALVAWSGLYESLGRTVAVNRPPRVVFRQSTGFEVPFEALLTWRRLQGTPTEIGVLNERTQEAAAVEKISARTLKAGDWVIERFGNESNREVPFRDVSDPRPAAHGLIRVADKSLLPLKLVHEHEARFAAPPTGWWFGSPGTAQIRWRVYEVSSSPDVIFEGLDEDYWMKERALLAVRPRSSTSVRIRFLTFSPGGVEPPNVLSVTAGNDVLAQCRSTRRLADCVVPLKAGLNPDASGWLALELTPLRTYRESPDGGRQLSFSLDPGRGGGATLETATAPTPASASLGTVPRAIK